VCRPDLSGSGQSPVEGSCEHTNEALDAVKRQGVSYSDARPLVSQ
jgi:hypothetical protein